MSIPRGIGGSPYSPSRQDIRVALTHEERRRAARTTKLGAGTLACARCDAPVAIGPEGRSPQDLLACPFCQHQAPLREFLSLALPTRPARVVVRVRVAPGQ